MFAAFSQSDAITNNVLAFGRNTQIVRADPTSVQSFDFEHNIVYWTQGEFLQGSFSDSKYLMDNNLYFCPGDCPTFGFPTFAQFFFLWQALGHDPHSIVADPMFVDPAHGNFALKPESPASLIGFQPIDLSTVGRRP